MLFFWDEHQESSGNLSHIHGLIGLERDPHLTDDEFRDFVCSLQKHCVADIIPGTELQYYIEQGLSKDTDDWISVKATAESVLSHTFHNKRCLVRKAHTGNHEEDFECRKHHPVFDGKNCMSDDFLPLPYQFSETCHGILQRL